MMRTPRWVVWGLLFMFLVVARESCALKSSELASAARNKGAQKGTMELVKPFMKDAYKFLIRQNLAPALRQRLLQMKQNFGTSELHKLARGWYATLEHQLGVASIPESWKTEAAEVHKALGGQGDFLAAPLRNERDGELNLSKGFLGDEFISYALFFLGGFVPEDISRCIKKREDLAIKCITKYEEPLQSALNSTLISFFHFVIPRTSASRIVTLSFILGAISPCPFEHLADPTFVYKAMTDTPIDLTKPLESIKSTLSAKPCPDFKTTLLRVLMAHGVTPADIMKAKNLEEELSKIPYSKEGTISAEKESIMEVSKFNQKDILKKGETADVPKEQNAGEILTELLSHFGASHPEGVEGFLNSRVGNSIMAYLAANEQDDRGYLDQVKELFESQKADGLSLGGIQLVDLIKELSDALGAEDEENLHHNVPLMPAKADSLDDAAKAVLEQIRSFKFQSASFIQPKEDKPEEKEGKK